MIYLFPYHSVQLPVHLVLQHCHLHSVFQHHKQNQDLLSLLPVFQLPQQSSMICVYLQLCHVLYISHLILFQGSHLHQFQLLLHLQVLLVRYRLYQRYPQVHQQQKLQQLYHHCHCLLHLLQQALLLVQEVPQVQEVLLEVLALRQVFLPVLLSLLQVQYQISIYSLPIQYAVISQYYVDLHASSLQQELSHYVRRQHHLQEHSTPTGLTYYSRILLVSQQVLHQSYELLSISEHIDLILLFALQNLDY